MHSRDYYRALDNDLFLQTMKDAIRLNDEMAIALLERVEELIEEIHERETAALAYEAEIEKLNRNSRDF